MFRRWLLRIFDSWGFVSRSSYSLLLGSSRLVGRFAWLVPFTARLFLTRRWTRLADSLHVRTCTTPSGAKPELVVDSMTDDSRLWLPLRLLDLLSPTVYTPSFIYDEYDDKDDLLSVTKCHISITHTTIALTNIIYTLHAPLPAKRRPRRLSTTNKAHYGILKSKQLTTKRI